jgi:rubrerythrin
MATKTKTKDNGAEAADQVKAAVEAAPEESAPTPEDVVEEPGPRGVQLAMDGDRKLTNRMPGTVPNFAEVTLKGTKGGAARDYNRQEVVTWVVRSRCVFAGLRDVMNRDEREKIERTVRVHDFEVLEMVEMDEDLQDALNATLFEATIHGDLTEEEAAEVAARTQELAEQDQQVREEKGAAEEPASDEDLAALSAEDAEAGTAEDWADPLNAPERRVVCEVCGETVEFEPVPDGETDKDRIISGDVHGCGIAS